MNNKSQAALEFLTTYAWAFLVILIMIAALAYFGILNPSRLLPDRCNFGAEITCDKSKMIVNNVAENTLAMELKNSFGEAVVITDVKTTTDNDAAGACTGQIADADVPPNVNWPSGGTVILNADCAATSTNIAEDDKIKFEIEIDYYAAAAGPTYTKTIFGDLVTSVQ